MRKLCLTSGLLLWLFTVTLSWADETSEQQVLLNAGDVSVTLRDLRQQLLLMPESEQSRVLSSPNSLKDFLRRIYQNKHMTLAAERLKLDEDPVIKARLVAERQRLLAEALREHTRKQIQSPDFAALAREHYAARREEFQLPEQYKAAHIMKKVPCDCERDKQRQATEQLRIRLQNGEDFAALARTESDDAGSAAKGGDLQRWLKREELVPPFVEALAKLEPGQLSEVVETQFGFHLIKKLDYQAARLQSFDEVKANLESTLREKFINDQLVGQGASYLPPVDVKFSEPALDALLTGH